MSRIVGIGTEIIECLRIAQMIEQYGEQFLERVFSAAEIEFCNNRRQSTEQFAAYWAAKEAAIKSLGANWPRSTWMRHVEIDVTPTGKNRVRFRGPARDAVERLDVADVMLTYATCRTHATAYAVAIGKFDEDDDEMFV